MVRRKDKTMSAKNTKIATDALRKRKRNRKRPVTPTSAFSDVSEFFTLREHAILARYFVS